jgi:hypothetical protein
MHSTRLSFQDLAPTSQTLNHPLSSQSVEVSHRGAANEQIAPYGFRPGDWDAHVSEAPRVMRVDFYRHCLDGTFVLRGFECLPDVDTLARRDRRIYGTNGLDR